MRIKSITFSIAAVACIAATHVNAAALECTDWQNAHPQWLWCDDFESDSALEQNYFDVERAGGRLRVSSDSAFGGSNSLRGTYQPGVSEAGSIKLSFGRTPVAPKRYTDKDFNDVYWRVYMKTSPNWTGNAIKLSRGTIFTASNWSQAAIGHLWEDDESRLGLGIDPASGVVGSQVTTTKYNDFDHLVWLGKANGPTQVYSTANRGKWQCIEIHMKLNTPGQSDGVFEYWVDGNSEAQKKNLNWRGSYTGYGINAVLLENYINSGAPQTQDRYFDNFVVSTSRIGCADSSVKTPNAPTNLQSQ